MDALEGICDEVPLEISGTYLADDNGNWEGDKEFEYSRAIYSFDFNRLETSEKGFAGIIDIALNRMDEITEIMKNNNLAITVLFWTSWVFVSSTYGFEANITDLQNDFLTDDKTHYFYLTGKLMLCL